MLNCSIKIETSAKIPAPWSLEANLSISRVYLRFDGVLNLKSRKENASSKILVRVYFAVKGEPSGD